MRVEKRKKYTPRWGRIIGMGVLVVGILVGSVFGVKTLVGTYLSSRQYYHDIVTETVSEIEGKQVNIKYPITKNELVNQMIKQYVDDTYDAFKTVSNHDETDSDELNLSYEVVPYNESIVSFNFTNYENHKSLAHGVGGVTSFTFDMNTGNVVQLKDLFESTDMYTHFTASLKEQIKTIVSDSDDEEPYLNNEEIDELIKETKNLVLDDDSITVYYEPYQIAPGYKSTQTITTDLESVQGLKLTRLNNSEADSPLGSNALDYYTEQKKAAYLKQFEGKKLIALTFDDGPHPSLTPELLEVLKSKDVVATFFMLGSRVEAHPEIVKQAAIDGHSIASHTYSHYNLAKLSTEELVSEIVRTQEAIKTATGVKPQLMRPPYGAYNETVLERAEAALIMWSVDTLDWKYRDANIVTQSVLREAEDGAIVLMHDIHPSSVEAVPGIIDGLRDAGYTFVSVDTLLEVRSELEHAKVYFAGRP